MINIKDIQKITNESNINQSKILIRTIDDRIANAAKNGKYEISEQSDNISLLKIIMNYYRDIGFNVSYPTMTREGETVYYKIVISWYS